MAWRKLGLVFAPTGRHPALVSHAALPVAAPLSGDLVRVFYSGRDAHNRSSIGSVVIRVAERPRVEEAPVAPLLTPGPLGTFDDSGLGVGSVVPGESDDQLYYMGWNVGGSVPWRNAIGVAVGSVESGRFERFSAGPIMDRDPVDHYSLSYPCVLNAGAGTWVMWYGTHLAWGADKADINHAIRRATSADGIAWTRSPEVVLGPEGDEIAVVRPSVLVTGESSRCGSPVADMGRTAWATPYPLMVSLGVAPIRRCRAPDTEDWEGGAATYPAAFTHTGRLWLLYNGKGYGATGFGLAIWEE